ncbi:hypothetical protein MKZ38_007378 [Zalerion maritima]|uniref:Uncharacterized protein n=1 Tax=Zalerion maritima TaxID=339359 RepID=A0AAD5RI35_9PEZI|nr:hypothetical protein MKZ38_007378 [Zalerion maritima]
MSPTNPSSTAPSPEQDLTTIRIPTATVHRRLLQIFGPAGPYGYKVLKTIPLYHRKHDARTKAGWGKVCTEAAERRQSRGDEDGRARCICLWLKIALGIRREEQDGWTETDQLKAELIWESVVYMEEQGGSSSSSRDYGTQTD